MESRQIFLMGGCKGCMICQQVQRLICIGSDSDEVLELLDSSNHGECTGGMVLRGICLSGIGKQKDALDMYEKASERGDLDGKHQALLLRLMIKEEPKDGLFAKANELAKEGQRYWGPLAFCYLDPHVCSRDIEKTFKMMERCEAAGNISANLWLGNLYESHKGFGQARQCYEKMLNAGYLYCYHDILRVEALNVAYTVTFHPCKCTAFCGVPNPPCLTCPKCNHSIKRTSSTQKPQEEYPNIKFTAFTCSPCHCTISCIDIPYKFNACPKCTKPIENTIDCID